MRLRVLTLTLCLALAGCATEPASPLPATHGFHLAVLSQEAWFVLQQRPDQITAARAGRLDDPAWAEFRRVLAAQPAAARPALQAEALSAVLSRVH